MMGRDFPIKAPLTAFINHIVARKNSKIEVGSVMGAVIQGWLVPRYAAAVEMAKAA